MYYFPTIQHAIRVSPRSTTTFLSTCWVFFLFFHSFMLVNLVLKLMSTTQVIINTCLFILHTN